jgi:hypothetical protein
MVSSKPLNEQEERFLRRVKLHLEPQGRGDKDKKIDKLSNQEKRFLIWYTNLRFDGREKRADRRRAHE